MKKKLKLAVAFAAILTFNYGCASSDTSTDQSDISIEPALTDQNEANPQAPMDPDTDMSAEGETNATVSASNEIGRNMNIVAMVQQNPNLSTFLELVRAADLVVNLESPAPYTVFVPTNEAFAALPAGTLEALKNPSSKMELTRILQAHVLPNRISTAEMKPDMPMLTAQGQEVIVKRAGSVLTVGGARILEADVQASNGIVHVIDKVLVPPHQ